jgi:basic amino acid/polyamine antiporter, APA family
MPGPAILRRKPIDDIEPEISGGGLQRTLGLRQLTAIGIGGIIGPAVVLSS